MKALPLLAARDLRLERGGACLLDIPSLSIREGETLALVGPNGAGKSTLLMCLAGLWRPTEGKISYRGGDVGAGGLLPYRRRISMVFQEPLLLSTTVYRNVATGLALRGMSGREVQERVLESLDRFRIAHLRDRSARTLSGGEAQRTSLARAFALEPEVIFLDEPLAALDPPTRDALLDDLAQNLRAARTTAVFATHDRSEALRLADRILVLRTGAIAQLGTPEEVMNRPVDEFVASFVGMETVLCGEVLKTDLGCLLVEVNGRQVAAVGDAAPGETVLLGIRPENVTVLRDPSPDTSSARNRFTGRVEKIVPQGPVQKVQLDCGFPLTAFVTQRSLEDLRLAPGAMVFASCKATAIHVIRARPRKTGAADPDPDSNDALPPSETPHAHLHRL